MNEYFTSYCFTDLPDPVQEKIFRCLSIDDLFRVGRTCKKWYRLSRDPRFWTRVDTGDFNLKTMSYNRIKYFLPALPSTATHLKLRFIPCSEEEFTIPELFLPIKERCPKLRVLVFHVCLVSYKGKTNKDFCIFDHLPNSVRVFAFQKGELETCNFVTGRRSKQFYPLVVLDLSSSVIPRGPMFFDMFERLVNLRELRLAYCAIWDTDIIRINTYVMSNLRVLDLEGSALSLQGFSFIKRWCINLAELYLCGTTLTNEDIRLENDNNLECLEILCLRRTAVTDNAIAKLIRFCDSLKYVYISYYSQLVRSYTLPRSKRSKIISITKMSSCRHYSRKNYMMENY